MVYRPLTEIDVAGLVDKEKYRKAKTESRIEAAPMDLEQVVKEAKLISQIGGADTDELMWDSIAQLGYEKHLQGAPLEEARQWAKEKFYLAKENRDKVIDQARRDLARRLKAGGGHTIFSEKGDIALSKDQQVARQEGRPYQYSPQQAILEIGRDLPAEDIVALAEHGYTDPSKLNPILQKAFREATEKRRMSAPSTLGVGLLGKAMDAPGVLGSAVSGAKEGALGQALKDVGAPAEKPREAWFDFERDLPTAYGYARDALDIAKKEVGPSAKEALRAVAKYGVPGAGLSRAAEMAGIPDFTPAGMIGKAVDLGAELAGGLASTLAPTDVGFQVGPEEAKKAIETAGTAAAIGFKQPGLASMGERAAEMLVGPTQERYGGVPVKEAADYYVRHPEKISGLVGASLEGASEALDFGARSDRIRLNLYDAKKKYWEDAARMAAGEGNPTRERATEIYKRLLSTDERFSWDPAKIQLAQETLLDPSTYAGKLNPLYVAGKYGAKPLAKTGAKAVARGAEELAKRSPVAERAIEKARGAVDLGKELFTYMPEAKDLEGYIEPGTEKPTGDFASWVRSVPTAAETEAHGIMGELFDIHAGTRAADVADQETIYLAHAFPELFTEGGLSTMAEADRRLAVKDLRRHLKGLSDDTRAEVLRRISEKDIPERIRPQIESTGKLAKSTEELRSKYGLGSRYEEAEKEGRLLGPRTKTAVGYIPEKIPLQKGPGVAEQFKEMFSFGKPWSRTTEAKTMSSAFERSGSQVQLLDVYQQFGVQLNELRKLLPKHIATRGIAEGLEEFGAVKHFEAPRDISAAVELEKVDSQISQKLEKLEKMNVENEALWKRKIVSDVDYKEAEKRALRGEQINEAAVIDDNAAAGQTGLLGEMKAYRNLRNRSVADKKKFEKQTVERGNLRREIESLRVQQRELTGKVEMGRATRAEILDTVEKMNRETGVKWVALDVFESQPPKGAIGKAAREGEVVQAARETQRGAVLPGDWYRRVTGEEGQFRGGENVTLMPAPVADIISTFAKIDKASTHPAAQAASWLMYDLIRPYQRIWRSTRTLLAIPYYVKNAMGAFGLSTLAHGVGALDPRLQGRALQAAFLSGDLGSEIFRDAMFTLKSGEKVPMGQLLDQMAKWGILDQSDLRLGLGMEERMSFLNRTAKNIEDVVYRGMWKGKPIGGERLGLNKVAPANINRIIENYQKSVAFMGFLEDMSPRSLARAADLTSQFAGNYARLGSAEKLVMKEAFGFYSWYRYILPHTIKQFFQNPARLAAWQRGVEYLQNKYGEKAPVFIEGMADYVRNFGYVSADQPERPSGILDAHSHEFAVTMLESPQYMGLSLVPNLLSFVSGGEGSQNLSDLAGPMTRFLVEAISKRDIRTGERIPFYQDLEDKSVFGNLLYGTVDRPTKEYQSIMQLYFDHGPPGTAEDLALRYKVGRDFIGLDYVLSEASKGGDYLMQQLQINGPSLGFESKSLGGMLETGVPGTQYLQNPVKEMTIRNARARE